MTANMYMEMASMSTPPTRKHTMTGLYATLLMDLLRKMKLANWLLNESGTTRSLSSFSSMIISNDEK